MSADAGSQSLLYDVRLCEAEHDACHRTYDSPGGDLSDDRIWIFTCGYCIENRDADFGTGISYWKDSVMEKK